jgi:redox-sensitive bicupin YhaK (pirin superfamily)
MSAGTGVRHSEFNHSQEEPVHFLQIWLEPNQYGVEPAYDQKHFATETRRGRLALLVSPDGREGSIATHQDALLFGSLLDEGVAVTYEIPARRKAYIHLARGALSVNGTPLDAGDGLTIGQAMTLHLIGRKEAEVLLFDLP